MAIYMWREQTAPTLPYTETISSINNGDTYTINVNATWLTKISIVYDATCANGLQWAVGFTMDNWTTVLTNSVASRSSSTNYGMWDQVIDKSGWGFTRITNWNARDGSVSYPSSWTTAQHTFELTPTSVKQKWNGYYDKTTSYDFSTFFNWDNSNLTITIVNSSTYTQSNIIVALYNT